jgi:peptide/nickel transport system substrate-binding protein
MNWIACARITVAFTICVNGAAASSANTLVFLAEDIPAGLDYDGPAAAVPTSQTGFVNLMDPLVTYAPAKIQDGEVRRLEPKRFEGRLAESWAYDPASLTWTFHLRHGVKSCSSNELTADDVIYTFARAKSVSGATPTGWFLSSVASIRGFTNDVFTHPDLHSLGDSVVKLDTYTVEFRQSAVNRLFLPSLATFAILIFDSREMLLHATVNDPWSHEYVNNVSAPGFGPYCVERWIKNNEFVLHANPNYYRGSPTFGRVVMKRIPQSANRYVLMRMHQASLAQGLTPRQYRALRDDPKAQVRGVDGNESLFLHMNFKTPPFDNIKLRQAFAYAIPYDQIIRNGYFGQAKKWNGVIPSSYPGYVAAETPVHFDLDRARALMAEAGFPNGRGLERYASAFYLAYIAEREETIGPIAVMIRTALRNLGVPVELDPMPLTQYGDREIVKKDLPFALNDAEKPAVVDAGYAVQLFFVSAGHGGLNNMVNYANPAVDRLWDQARNEGDDTRRTVLIGLIQRQLFKDVAWLPIVEYRTQWALDPRVNSLVWYPDNSVRFFDLDMAR